MSTKRFIKGGRVAKDPKKLAALPRGPNGRCLCRYCSTEVPEGRLTFCSDPCVHEWKLRTSGSYLRRCVLKRDKGICVECGLDCVALKKTLAKLKKTDPEAWWEQRAEMAARGFPSHRKNMWDVDHILEVARGGGQCGLDGVRTVCIPCHKKKTIAFNKYHRGRDDD